MSDDKMKAFEKHYAKKISAEESDIAALRSGAGYSLAASYLQTMWEGWQAGWQASRDAQSDDGYLKLYKALHAVLAPAYEYVQTHQSEFNIGPGNDMTPVIVEAFLQSRKPAQSEEDAVKRVEPMAYARKSDLESLPFSNAGQIALTLFKEARPDRVALGVINDATAAPAQSEAKPVKGNLADRLDAMADRSRMGSQEASDLYAAATIWRKHISRHATPVPIKPAESSDRHSDDEAVDQFARLMREKMAVSRAKGRHGWDDPEQCDTEDLVAMMVEHITKGDVIDIANFCMMLHWRGATADMIRAACGDYFAPIGAGDAEDAARYREVRSGYGVNADLKPPVTLIYATVYEHKKGSIPSTRAVIGQELDRLVDAALLAKRGGA